MLELTQVLDQTDLLTTFQVFEAAWTVRADDILPIEVEEEPLVFIKLDLMVYLRIHWALNQPYDVQVLVKLLTATFVHSCAEMGLPVCAHSFVQLKAAACLAQEVSKAIFPGVLERLPVHNELVKEVKLLLDGPGPKVVLFNALFDEVFHLQVIEYQLVDILKMFLRFFILHDTFEKVLTSRFGCTLSFVN